MKTLISVVCLVAAMLLVSIPALAYGPAAQVTSPAAAEPFITANKNVRIEVNSGFLMPMYWNDQLMEADIGRNYVRIQSDYPAAVAEFAEILRFHVLCGFDENDNRALVPRWTHPNVRGTTIALEGLRLDETDVQYWFANNLPFSPQFSITCSGFGGPVEFDVFDVLDEILFDDTGEYPLSIVIMVPGPDHPVLNP